jgi:hypothetical protein
MEYREIKYEGFKAMLISKYVRHGHVYWIELVGELGSARAIAAALVSDDTRGMNYVQGAGSLHKGESYKVISSVFQRDNVKYGRYLIAHYDFLLLGSNETLLFVQNKDAEEVPDGFFGRLNPAVGIPMYEEWEKWLWEEGQNKVYFYKAHEKESGRGSFISRKMVNDEGDDGPYRFWKVRTDPRGWGAILARHDGLEPVTIEPNGKHWQGIDQAGNIWSARSEAGKLVLYKNEEVYKYVVGRNEDETYAFGQVIAKDLSEMQKLAIEKAGVKLVWHH